MEQRHFYTTGPCPHGGQNYYLEGKKNITTKERNKTPSRSLLANLCSHLLIKYGMCLPVGSWLSQHCAWSLSSFLYSWRRIAYCPVESLPPIFHCKIQKPWQISKCSQCAEIMHRLQTWIVRDPIISPRISHQYLYGWYKVVAWFPHSKSMKISQLALGSST